jgi:hypothetical protein
VMVSVVALTVASSGSPSEAGDGFSGSLVGEFADMTDMEPLLAMDASGKSAAKPRPASAKTGVRQSVPDRDRAASYRSDEFFGYSKVAVPLLVVDIEPRQLGFDVLPMSGRSVGARPSAAWTRPLGVSAAATVEPASRVTGTWRSVGR